MNVQSVANAQSDASTRGERHSGPNLGIVATIYVVLFLAGLAFVTVFVTDPAFPSPNAAPNAIVTYFQIRPSQVRISAFLSFGAAVVLGVFVASTISRLRFLGVRSAWVDIALYAGLATAFDQTASHFCEWALTWPGITQSAPATLVIYYLLYVFGGPGFSVLMGLFVGSVSIMAGSMKLLPKWIVWFGFVIAIIGLVSWLNVLLPTFSRLPLTIPLTRFPSFVWLIAAGFALPNTTTSSRK